MPLHFSFVQALSQCVTFVPEQAHWKEQVHDFASTDVADPVQTAANIQRDDGFGLGMIYRQARQAWMPETHQVDSDDRALHDMLEEFSVSSS